MASTIYIKENERRMIKWKISVFVKSLSGPGSTRSQVAFTEREKYKVEDEYTYGWDSNPFPSSIY